MPVPYDIPENNPAALFVPEGSEPVGFDQDKLEGTGAWEAAKDAATSGWYLTANLAIRANEALSINKILGIDEGKALTNDEYEKSEYKRPGLTFKDGVSETLANEEAQRYDTKQIREDIISRSSQTGKAKMARFGMGLAGSFANPIFWTVGGAVGRLVAPIAKTFSEAIPVIKGLSPELQSFLKQGMIHGPIIMPAFQAIDETENKLHQGEFSLLNVARAIIPGFILGLAGASVGHVISEVISSRSPYLKSDFAKESGINKPREGAADETAQAVSQEDHEAMAGAAISQMENNKVPDVSEIAKQSYYDSWTKRYGDEYRRDPEAFQRSIDEVKKNTEHDKDRLDKVNSQIDDLISAKEPEDFQQMLELKDDKENLEKAIDHQSLIADMKSNPPEMPGDTDVSNYINKMNSPKTDYSYRELKPPVDLKDPDVAADEIQNFAQEKFNSVKKTLSKDALEEADTTEIKTRHKGIRQFYEAVKDCITRGAA